MNILVTGGKGFIGRALVKRLKAEGHSVETFDLIDRQDLLNYEQIEKAVAGKDMIFHLAAVADLNWARDHPKETMDINITGTVNVARACVKHGAFLQYASTCCVYGNQERHPISEKAFYNPAEIYACSKLAGEYVIRGFHLMYGLKYNFLRFATIYGPWMRAALGIHIFFTQALKGKPITVHGDGKQTRTFTYIDDLIDGILAVVKADVVDEAINLTTTEEISTVKMAQMIKKITGSTSKIVFIPQRPGQTFREFISAAKAKKMCGWEAKISFKQGLKKTYAWFMQELTSGPPSPRKTELKPAWRQSGNIIKKDLYTI